MGKPGKKEQRIAEKQEREEERQRQKQLEQQRQQEEAWHQEEVKTKAEAKGSRKLKRDEEAAKRAEEQRRKEEMKKQAKEEEEAELSKVAKGGKLKDSKPGKVTQAERQRHREEQAEKLRALSEEKREELQRTIGVDEYKKLLDSFENVNREELGEVDATSLSNALEQLEVISTQQERMTFNKFKERELPGLMEEKPGLRKSQYVDILYTRWKRSPENPANQAKYKE